jgi:hypothetical protein
MNSYSGPPMTLGNAAAAAKCGSWFGASIAAHRGEPGPADVAERFGADMTVPIWRARPVYGGRGSPRVGMVATGERR